MKSVRSGVPQGSILGPLLFLVFINDITNSSNNFKVSLYADDCALSYSYKSKDANTAANNVNTALKDVIRWINCNKLSINVNKTGCLVFSYRGEPAVGDIVINGEIIKRANCIKYLGFNIDNHLTFKNHIDHVSTKISKGIGLLYKLNRTLPLCALKSIYFTLINSHLVYGIEMYHNTAAIYKDRLFKMQKKAIRAINCLNFYDHTNNYFFCNKILKLKDIHTLHTCVYMFKTFHFNFDVNLHNSFRLHSDIHQYSTRNNNDLLLPRFTKSKSQNSIDYVGVSLWNGLHSDIKIRSSVSKFRETLKCILLEKYE